jgi:hypothetical protein
VEGYTRHVKAVIPPERASELEDADQLALRLLGHITSTHQDIAAIHVHGAQSKSIQNHFASLLRTDLGFNEEVVFTPQTGFVTHARPDSFYRLAPGRGIIAEAERGGTTTNNHDLKDL